MQDANENPELRSTPPHSKRMGREIAMQYLFSCDMTSEFPDAVKFGEFFDGAADELGISDHRTRRKARDYAEKLFTLVAVNLDRVDNAIRDGAEHWDWERLSLVDRNIMRVAVSEMFFCDDVPAVVSIDEAVGIARDYSGAAAGSFINGVLNGVKNTLPDGGQGKKE